MPCYMTGSAEGDARLAAHEAREAATKLTRLLCAACAALEAAGLVDAANAELSDWWSEHKRIDTECYQREADAKRRDLERDRQTYEQLKRKLGIAKP